VNKIVPNRTKKESYEANKVQLLQHMKEYRDEPQNADKLRKTRKDKYQRNRTEILRKAAVQHHCSVCDGRYTTNNESKHYKTEKHITAVENSGEFTN